MNDQLAGEFLVEAHAKDSLSDKQISQLETLLDAFLGAIESGMFFPAELVKAHSVDSREEQRLSNISSKRRFAASNLPSGAFGILSGMLAYYSMMIAPLDRYVAYQNGMGLNLLDAVVEYPPATKGANFQITIQEPQGIAPSLLIRVEFFKPPAPETRKKFTQPFKYWDELLCGGFPVSETAPGYSGVGASETLFIDPSTVEHYLEAYSADPACFNLIINLAAAWSNDHPVRSVEIG
jgi:hypothetical protein